MNLCIQCWFDEIFDTLQTVCLGCDCYVTIRSALHCYRTRNTWLKCASSLRMRVTLLYWPLFYTYFAIDFSERAIPANIDRSILLTARMGRYDIKVALLRCLIRLIIKVINLKFLAIFLRFLVAAIPFWLANFCTQSLCKHNLCFFMCTKFMAKQNLHFSAQLKQNSTYFKTEKATSWNRKSLSLQLHVGEHFQGRSLICYGMLQNSKATRL